MYIYYILSPKDTVSQIIINTSLIVSYVVSKFFYWLSGIKVSDNIGKIQKSERCIIIANHVSRHDAHLIVSALPVSVFKTLLPIRFFTAKKELDKKIIGNIIRVSGGFPARSVENRISGLKGGIRLSDKGETLFMFPQGKMSQNNSKFMTGIAYLVKKRNFCIIPAYVSISDNKFSKKEVHFGKSFTLTRKQASLSDDALTALLQECVFSLNKI